MLFIKWTDREGKERQYSWHYSEPPPDIQARVVTFQADGDELDFLMDAIRKTHKPVVLCDRDGRDEGPEYIHENASVRLIPPVSIQAAMVPPLHSKNVFDLCEECWDDIYDKIIPVEWGLQRLGG